MNRRSRTTARPSGTSATFEDGNQWDRWVLVPAVLWALLGLVIVAGGARADHDANPSPSVEECQAIVAEHPNDFWYKAPEWHGEGWLCAVLKLRILARSTFESRRDFLSTEYPKEWAVDPHNTWAEWQAWRGEIHPSWLVEWGEEVPEGQW